MGKVEVDGGDMMGWEGIGWVGLGWVGVGWWDSRNCVR